MTSANEEASTVESSLSMEKASLSAGNSTSSATTTTTTSSISSSSTATTSSPAVILPPPPSTWPQAPLFLRSTPGTGMRIRGVRYSSDAPGSRTMDDWCAAGVSTTATTAIAENSNTYNDNRDSDSSIPLPVNSGTEAPGKALVIDFESPLFTGTLLVRVKGSTPAPDISTHQSEHFANDTAAATGTDKDVNDGDDDDDGLLHEVALPDDSDNDHGNENDEATSKGKHRRRRLGKGLGLVLSRSSSVDGESSPPSYFDGKQRSYQCVIRGRFKVQPATTPTTLDQNNNNNNNTHIPMSQICTGQLFDRPAQRLPKPWMVQSAIALFTTLSPQLKVKLTGVAHPHCLSPTMGQAQTIHVERDLTSIVSSHGMEDELDEPDATDPSSVLYEATVLEDSGSGESGSASHRRRGFLGLKSIVKGSNDTSTPAPRCTSVVQRRALRKKRCNQWAVAAAAGSTASEVDPAVATTFDADAEYTFEFVQHLFRVDEDDFAISTGAGKIGLASRLDGQPIKIMSAWDQSLGKRRSVEESTRSAEAAPYQLDTSALRHTALWSFELWHTALYPYAVAAASSAKKEEQDNALL